MSTNKTTTPEPVVAPQVPITRASELYAVSQGYQCNGEDACHWCAASCPRLWPHDDPPRMIGQRVDNRLVKRPSNAYICKGCWLFRRTRITVRFLTADSEMPFKDIQCPINHSWFITRDGAWGIRKKEDAAALYEILIDPPLQFVLTLISPGQRNHIQIAVLNDLSEITGDTNLKFTLDGAEFAYTPYELEAILTQGPSGVQPGTKALFDFLGPYQLKEKERKITRGVGRPKETAAVPTPATAKVLKKKGES